jgi:lipid-binding SYLF domain-containing protein
MNQKGLERMLLSSLTLGGDVGVAAGPVGRGTSIGTDVLLQSAILTYGRSKGLFAGVDLGGATISYDTKATLKVYGQEMAAKDLLFSHHEVPAGVKVFPVTLAKYAPTPEKTAALQ